MKGVQEFNERYYQQWVDAIVYIGIKDPFRAKWYRWFGRDDLEGTIRK
jgi:hypothetical protein